MNISWEYLEYGGSYYYLYILVQNSTLALIVYKHLFKTSGKMHSFYLEQNCKLYRLYVPLHLIQIQRRYASVYIPWGNYVHFQCTHCLEDNRGNTCFIPKVEGTCANILFLNSVPLSWQNLLQSTIHRIHVNLVGMHHLVSFFCKQWYAPGVICQHINNSQSILMPLGWWFKCTY